MRIVRVSSVEDPRLEDYRSLQEGTRVRDRGRFIAEGPEVVTRLIDSAWPIVSLLVEASQWQRRASRWVGLGAHVPTYVADRELLQAVVGFRFHRGVLACGAEPAHPIRAEGRAQDRAGAAIALLGVSDHQNVGACFRHAAAFGVSELLLDGRAADPLYRKAIRVSMGHVFRVPFDVLHSEEDVLRRLDAGGYAAWALTPSMRASSLDEVLEGRRRVPPRVALVVGAEGSGLSGAVLGAAAAHIRVPMAAGVDSLNAATALAVALYALRHVSPRSFGGPGGSDGGDLGADEVGSAEFWPGA